MHQRRRPLQSICVHGLEFTAAELFHTAHRRAGSSRRFARRTPRSGEHFIDKGLSAEKILHSRHSLTYRPDCRRSSCAVLGHFVEMGITTPIAGCMKMTMTGDSSSPCRPFRPGRIRGGKKAFCYGCLGSKADRQVTDGCRLQSVRPSLGASGAAPGLSIIHRWQRAAAKLADTLTSIKSVFRARELSVEGCWSASVRTQASLAHADYE
ncbi:uncharacterized protein F5Z01DRAFT_362400 [Emericellopsis atlantica]|uniref:Uncharacterized protein n=1 Tax=Emericellopsis atlantica TaxID=2614577 RepID=A0A9P7ZFC7_9HYPO|nr:uncharacterized protein F5Z01DRAFT_362400 [Emericellopsis atlantica]KAG9250443.1 hypothetical protein F5Z01DRAFT_362400 [Emericellopsis atlantica]